MATRLTPKEFARFLDRDLYCQHCGEREAIAPNHRVNRGMGGSKLRSRPSNIVILCSLFNGLIESDPAARAQAIAAGWKLESWQDPRQVPSLDALTGVRWLLDDSYQREAVPMKRES